MESESAKVIPAIDGCPLDCARKSLEEANINEFEHLRLIDLGMEQGQASVSDQLVDKVVAAGVQQLAGGSRN